MFDTDGQKSRVSKIALMLTGGHSLVSDHEIFVRWVTRSLDQRHGVKAGPGLMLVWPVKFLTTKFNGTLSKVQMRCIQLRRVPTHILANFSQECFLLL